MLQGSGHIQLGAKNPVYGQVEHHPQVVADRERRNMADAEGDHASLEFERNDVVVKGNFSRESADFLMSDMELRDGPMGDIGQGGEGIQNFGFRDEVILDEQGVAPVSRQSAPHVHVIDLLTGDSSMFDQSLCQLDHEMVGEQTCLGSGGRIFSRHDCPPERIGELRVSARPLIGPAGSPPVFQLQWS